MQDEPFAVCIRSRTMQQTQCTPFARDVCFVDSTASCNADNKVITFLLVPSADGAVPLEVVLMENSYTVGFKLLKTILPANAFGRQQFRQYLLLMTLMWN